MGMPDYIDKILKEKLSPSTQTYDQEDMVSLLAPVDRNLTLKYSIYLPHLSKMVQVLPQADTPIKITRDSFLNRDTSSLQTSREIGSPKLIWI